MIGLRRLVANENRRWELLLFVILVLTVVFNVSQSTNYVGVNNFINLFELSIEKIIIAVVMAFVIISGEIDLSVASVMGVGACVIAALHGSTSVPFALAIVVAVGVGGLAGLVQGWCTARLGVPSLVVTLAGLIGFRGLARILVEDRSIGDFPAWFDSLGQTGLIGPLPFSVIVFFVAIAFGGVLLSRTGLGRRAYVIGDNAEMARFSGIDVVGYKIRLFVVSGAVASFAGVLFAARLGSVRGDLATGFELDIITIVLLGGVSIFGGTGSMIGVFTSILIVLNLRNGLGLANVEANTQTGIIGVILIASVVLRNAFDRLDTPAPDPDAGSGSAKDDRKRQTTSGVTVAQS
jgi:rhamnose transport system permease protein